MSAPAALDLPDVQSFFPPDTSTRAFVPPVPLDLHTLQSQHDSAASSIIQPLDAEIARLEVLLGALREKHTIAAKTQSMNVAYIAVSPIRKLPREVLLVIFDFACDISRPLDDFDAKTVKTPLRLACTCALWRTLLLATPTLWSCIVPAEGLMTSLFLERSKDVPLNVRIGYSFATGNDDHKRFFDTCHRWRTLSDYRWRNVIDYSYEDSNDTKNTLERHGLPLLEWAHIDNGADPYSPLVTVLQNAPRLRSISMKTIRSGDMDIQIPSHIRQICGPGTKAIEDILSGAQDGGPKPDAGLHFLLTKGTYGWIGRPCVLPAVTALTVKLESKQYYEFFSAISIPTLIDLTLLIEEQPRPSVLQTTVITEVTAFVLRSMCALVAFRLVMKKRDKAAGFDIVKTAGDLLSFLDVTPDLETLHIIESAPILLTVPFFKRLVASETFLPKLKDVKFVWMPQERGRNVVLIGVQKLVIKFLDERTGEVNGDDDEEMEVSRLTKVILGLRQGVELPDQLIRRVEKLRADGVTAWVW